MRCSKCEKEKDIKEITAKGIVGFLTGLVTLVTEDGGSRRVGKILQKSILISFDFECKVLLCSPIEILQSF